MPAKIKPNRKDIGVLAHVDALIPHLEQVQKDALIRPLTQEQKDLYLSLSVRTLEAMGFTRSEVIAMFFAPKPVVTTLATTDNGSVAPIPEVKQTFAQQTKPDSSTGSMANTAAAAPVPEKSGGLNLFGKK